jgi:hypothetical protein
VENCGDGNEVITNRCDSSDRAGRITAADFAYFVCLAAPAQADWRKAAMLLRQLAACWRADYGEFANRAGEDIT